VPLWDLSFRYAEQFHIDPQLVPKTVTVRTWLRWRLRENARNSRAAHEYANREGVEWAKLPPETLRAMQWGNEEEMQNGNTD
jgi:hypothetical protein